MKRTLTLLAILAAIGPAWGAEVVSSNIVGYTKVSLQAGLNLIGSQFVLVGGQDANMNELTTALAGQTGFDDESYEPTTELRLWNGRGYDKYGWSGNLLTESPNFASDLGVDDNSLDNKWLNDDYEAADDLVETGNGFWVKAANVGTITLAGEVPEEDTVTVNLVAGLNLVSYPWPMEVSLQKITVAGQTGFDDESYEPTTEIRIWNGRGYDKFGWSGNLLTESPNFASDLGVDDNSLDNKWLDDDYAAATDTLDVGAGFWIKAPNAGTVTFSK